MLRMKSHLALISLLLLLPTGPAALGSGGGPGERSKKMPSKKPRKFLGFLHVKGPKKYKVVL